MPTLQLIPRNETNQSERLAPLSESFELNGSKVCARQYLILQFYAEIFKGVDFTGLPIRLVTWILPSDTVTLSDCKDGNVVSYQNLSKVDLCYCLDADLLITWVKLC